MDAPAKKSFSLAIKEVVADEDSPIEERSNDSKSLFDEEDKSPKQK